MIKNIHEFLWKLKTLQFILTMTILSFLITIPFTLLLPPLQNHPSNEDSIFIQILSVLIIAPLIETLIFQKFLFWIMQMIPWIRKYDILVITIPAIIFGLNHQFGITYIICTTIVGMLYNYAYWIYQKKNTENYIVMSAFWTVFWIHELHNIFALLIQDLLL
ncbi:CPBP family glutamic-type intramembrane protease [Bacillus wiedmannii]|uniref:CPBP family glutamic-type intramembrane protease n=1 Tax=Bacillus wiedmannii TaxID=1890302 RepID=UPI000BF74454|nr:CPBP family glutamic-type intramembrane protease [Bacillus wiedmannii]PFZ83457.1 CPBP family intramembrane metalloprotease [Bacillus wiedmannii]